MITQFFLAIVSILIILFLPGFLISLLFFKWKDIEFIERIITSFAISLVIIPLGAYYIHLLGIKITLISVMGEVIFFSLLSLGILLIKKWREKT